MEVGWSFTVSHVYFYSHGCTLILPHPLSLLSLSTMLVPAVILFLIHFLV